MTETPSPQIQEMARRWLPAEWDGRPLKMHTDTSDFFDIGCGDAILLDGRPYLIRNSGWEGRFGLDDEAKHWVKRGIDLARGDMCVDKLVFYEKFQTTVGGIAFDCFRSPPKEEVLFGSISSKIVNHARNCTVWVVE